MKWYFIIYSVIILSLFCWSWYKAHIEWNSYENSCISGQEGLPETWDHYYNTFGWCALGILSGLLSIPVFIYVMEILVK